MKKLLSIVLALCVSFLNVPPSDVIAAEVAHAASRAEAQTLISGAFGGVSKNDTLYTFIGSGFTGIGEQIKTVSESIIKELLLSIIHKKENVYNDAIISDQSVWEKALIHEKIIPYQTPSEKLIKPGPKPIDLPMITPPAPVKEKFISDEKKESTKAITKEEEKEGPLYLPIKTEDSEELAALLEGELVGTPFLGINTTTYKVIGATLAVTGIIFLILGTSGVFSSSGGSNDGSGHNPGESGNGINGIPPFNGENENNEHNDGNNGSSPVIPEPGMLSLIIAGLCSVFVWRRFRL